MPLRVEMVGFSVTGHDVRIRRRVVVAVALRVGIPFDKGVAIPNWLLGGKCHIFCGCGLKVLRVAGAAVCVVHQSGGSGGTW